MKRRLVWMLLAAIGTATWPCAGQTPTSSPAAGLPAQLPPLPEIAVEATRLGLEATARKDWPEAIRHFREARSAAPEDPAVLYRLALAHDRAGHGLPAIAWFRAFLAVVPQANNAPDIRERIAQLEKANQEEAYQLALVDLRVAGGALSPEIAYILAKSGRRDEAERLFETWATSGKTESDRNAMWASVAEGLCERGDYPAAREIVDRFPDTDERRKTLLWETIESQALQGDVEGALKFAKTSNLSAVRLAVLLAQEGRAIETVDLLYDVPLDDLLTPEMQFALANTLPKAESLFPGGTAVRGIYFRHDNMYKSAIAMVQALAEWGYVAQAEDPASFIVEANWRFLADLDILVARAAFRQISREQQIREIERRLANVTDAEVKERGYLAILNAQLAMNDLKGAQETASRIKNAGAHSPFRMWLPVRNANASRGWYPAQALRVLFPAQALHGEISKAEATARSSGWSFGFNDKSIEAFFEALKPGGGELGKIILTAEQLYSVEEVLRVGGTYSLDQDLLHQAVVFHAQRDDIEAARNVARFHNGLVESGSLTHARSQLVIAGALARLGRTAESKKVFAEALDSVGGDAYKLADHLARDDNVAGLRAVVRQTWENSAGRTLPAVFHKLSLLQRSIGDVEGAEQTARLFDYSPQGEAADWSATALRLEAREECVTPVRDYLIQNLDRPNMVYMNSWDDRHRFYFATFRANQLLEIQFELRDRAARWRRREQASGVPATSRN